MKEGKEDVTQVILELKGKVFDLSQARNQIDVQLEQIHRQIKQLREQKVVNDPLK